MGKASRDEEIKHPGPLEGGASREPPFTRLGNDPDILELIADFLTESEDELTKVEQLFAKVDRGGANLEQVNFLFRVFHSIKGTASFLNAPDVRELAHAAEAVLRVVRDGEMALSGLALEAVSDAADLMRALVEDIGAAVQKGGVLVRRPELAAILAKLVEAGREAAPLTLEAARPDSTEPTAASAKPGDAQQRGEARLPETLRVDVGRVDAAVELISSLIVAEAMLVHSPEVSAIQSHDVRRALHQVVKLSRELHDLTMRMRMVPVRAVFDKVARMARSLSKSTGKPLQFEVKGEETEIDRGMVEQLQAPLVHIVRNALDHGIEPSEERRAAGKPAVATLRMAASQDGGQIVVAVSDDGRGLQRQKILKKARSRGLIPADEKLSNEQIHALVFSPGFSTASKVTDISGRGVGLDVVKKNVERLRGRVQLWSTEGQGTTLRMVLPLTLAVIDGTFVSCGEGSYVIPSSAILELLVPTREAITTFAGQVQFLNVRGQLIPLRRLSLILDSPSGEIDPTRAVAVVVESGDQKSALLVDEVVAQRQIVVKPLHMPPPRAEHFSGATILPDGSPGLIIDVDRLSDPVGRATA